MYVPIIYDNTQVCQSVIFRIYKMFGYNALTCVYVGRYYAVIIFVCLL